MKISGLTIVKNAISNGYLIAEVIDNLTAIADEIIVCDGYSTDGTAEYLKQRSDIILYQDHWHTSNNGKEFANITNLGLSRCSGDYICYLQADEIIHENQIDALKSLINSGIYNSIICNFHHIRYDFGLELDGGYKHAIRVVKNVCGISSLFDGYDFTGAIRPQMHSAINIYHFGYVFLYNILNKMINHADWFYLSSNNYQHRKDIAIELIDRLNAGEHIDPLTIQPILEPEYKLCEHHLPMPGRVERLKAATHYLLPHHDTKLIPMM